MERQDAEVHVDTEQARAGSTPHVVRYVLMFSLLLAIAALSLIWITGALGTGETGDSIEQRATGQGYEAP